MAGCVAGVLVFAALAAAQTAGKPATAPATKSGAQSSKPSGARAAAKAAEPVAEPDEPIPPAVPGALFPAVVARVNNRAVLGRDLEQRIQTQLAPMGNPKWSNLREEYRQELIRDSLGELIGSELIYQKAVAGGGKATPAEVSEEFARFAKGFGSDAELNMALGSRGLDRPGLTRELDKLLTIRKWVQENVEKKIAVTPAEVSKYYQEHTEEFRHPDQVRSSHILIAVPASATPEQERLAQQRAETLLGRVKKGEDFAKLAKDYSTDTSASQGGDIGFAPRGQLAPEYEDAAFELPAGGVSGVVRTQFGFHIIKVTEKRKAGVATFEQVQAQLGEFLKGQKAQAELVKIVDQLRSQAKIVAYIDSGTPSGDAPKP
jgi:peptidyl-prolyl cis-trans isomerase C